MLEFKTIDEIEQEYLNSMAAREESESCEEPDNESDKEPAGGEKPSGKKRRGGRRKGSAKKAAEKETAEEKQEGEKTEKNTEETPEPADEGKPEKSINEETAKGEEAPQEAEQVSIEEDVMSAEAEEGDSALVAELKDRLVRQMAEFDNYRKRTEKEKKQNYEIGASDFILKLLPVVDNFERGFESIKEEEKDSSFAQGIEMIYKQLMKVLEDEGVAEIEALGKPFDPEYHNAVMQQESDEYDSGVVMQVFQKGYMYKDRVLRHSMVIVAQ